MQEQVNKQQIVEYFLGKEILIEEKTIEKIDENNFDTIKKFVEAKEGEDTLFLDEEINQVIDTLKENETKPKTQGNEITQEENKEEQKKETTKEKIERGTIKIIKNYDKEVTEKKTVQHFVESFKQRYKKIEKLLRNRQELRSITSINRILQRKERDSVSLIGIVREKQVTKNNHIILILEDLTGEIKVLATTNNEKTHKVAKEVSLDEVIGITGMNGEEIVFASTIIRPEVTITREFKKAPKESYALFMGDLHFGSKVFLKEKFEKFKKWLKCEAGTEEQKKTVKKIKYLFLVGDLIEGVGIYPSQEEDLEIKDVYDQYKELEKFVKEIPDHIHVVIIPGNHDAVRLSEPQPPLAEEYVPNLYQMENVHLLSNPSRVNIDYSDEFPGFDILLYHGFSFPFYADSVEKIREKGGQKRSDLIMQYLMEVRHLAPSHTSNLYSPDKKEDAMVIDSAPDFFVTGHIHRVSAVNYKNMTLLNCSSWLEETEYQQKVGLIPEPARAIIVNLKTRDVKIIKF